MVAKVASDMVEGGVDLLNRHAVEFSQMLVDLARRTQDDPLLLKVIEAGLDRVGISKVNKSESKVTKTERAELTATDDFWDKFEALPIDSQKKIADLMSAARTELEEAQYSE
jgi:hypothetical protein